MRKALALIILLSSYCYGEKCYHFIVYRDKINKTTEDAIKTKGALSMATINDGQGYKITRTLVAPNTNYMDVYVMPSAADKTYFATLLTSKYAVLISTSDVIRYYNNMTGGYEQEFFKGEINALPKDYYDVWIASKTIAVTP